MTLSPSYTVRPLSNNSKSSSPGKDALRIYLSKAALATHDLSSGLPCQLKSVQGAVGTAIAWPAYGEVREGIAQTSKVLQTAFGLKLGDQITLSKSASGIKLAECVQVTEIGQAASIGETSENLSREDDNHWEWYLEWVLKKAGYVCKGMVFEGIELKGLKRSFRIERVSSSSDDDDEEARLYHFEFSSNVRLKSWMADSTSELQRRLEITNDGIGGLEKQLQQLNQRLSAFNDELRSFKMPSWCQRRLRRGDGILLHGPEGTGKTLLLKKLSAASWRKVCYIDSSIIGRYLGDTEKAVRKVFDEALKNQPSLVVIDDIEAIAGKTKSENVQPDVASAIGTGLDRLEDSKVLVVAATRRPLDTHESLRKRGRLGDEIEIPIPNVDSRIEILKVLQELPRLTPNELCERLGRRTHGYVGADLDRVIDLAVQEADKRCSAQYSPQPTAGEARETTVNDEDALDEISNFNMLEADFENALLEVRPSAMREVFLEAPKVRWTDIGGQEEVKQNLREVVEWPFKYPSQMARLGITPINGLLLYGPPGCSKTLTAQALATESGLNFIAVKGAELLSMYVGESERAVREVFRKARTASPSIIFFDEIDAIGASLVHGGGSGVNVLTTMLNEMDGIEQLKGVLVVAATNKPELLDPALMRPGRLDTILYVGPPDLDARHSILKIRTRNMEVGEDVDIGALALSTEGYSGAEMVSICNTAARAAFREFESEGIEVPVCSRHFDLALAKVERQISVEVRQRYEQWSVGGTKKL